MTDISKIQGMKIPDYTVTELKKKLSKKALWEFFEGIYGDESMNRQIKFRAWHMPFGPEGPMQEMVHGKASSILALADMSPDEYIVEQFTGLIDKNGQEIYEGDIVKSSYKYAQPKISQVIMEDGNSYILGEDLATGNEMLVSDHINEIEVISNVHTNPELLEAQHDTQTD